MLILEFDEDNTLKKSIDFIIEDLRKYIVNNKLNLLESLGGEAGMEKFVDIFYEKVSENPYLKDFFNNLDMEK